MTAAGDAHQVPCIHQLLVLRQQPRWKLVTPRGKPHQKWSFVQNTHSFNECLAISSPAVLFTPSWTLTSSPSSLDFSHLFQAICLKQNINSTKFKSKLNFWTVSYLSVPEIRSGEFMHPYFIKNWSLSSLFIISRTLTFLEIILLTRSKTTLTGIVLSLCQNIIVPIRSVL